MHKEQLSEHLRRYHHGAENAVNSKNLELAFSVTGKELRDTVNVLRREGVPIASDQSGYFYAKTEAEVRTTIRHMKNRIAGISAAIVGLRRAVLSFQTPSESMGGTRGELVPARESHRERSEPSSSAEDACDMEGGDHS